MLAKERTATATQEGCCLRDAFDERRGASRIKATMTISCRPLDANGFSLGRGQVRDVSSLGVGFYYPRSLEVGSLLEIDLIKERRSHVYRTLARVVHVDTDASGAALIGCAFIHELTDHELRLFQAERAQPAHPDCRRWVRFPCNVETVCYTSETAPGERRPARIVNISAGGVGLLLACQFSKGTLLRFLLPADVDHASRDLMVRVVREMEQGNGYWFHGCEFVHQLSDEEMRSLIR